jgi:hypothetical protein
MKHNLGKCLLLLSFFFAQAEDFSHTFHVDNTHPYVKEAVILTLELKQSNPDIVLMFNFELEKSTQYSFQRVDTQEVDIHKTQGLHNIHVKYVYLIYPLVHGPINIHFKLLKKVTTDDSVAYSFSGDRDNVKGLVTANTNIVLPPLALHVKALPKDTQIVGDFTLDYSLKQHKADAHEPLPFHITLAGKGFPPLLLSLLKDVNFTVFKEAPLEKSITNAHGTQSTVIYPMALSHSKSFTLPALVFNAFNPKTQNSYILTVPEQKFAINEVSQGSLVDSIDSPKVLTSDWSWVTGIFTFLCVFIAGFFSALSWKWTKKRKEKKVHPLKIKIQNAKDTKALLQVLLAVDTQRFRKSIKTLESSLYANGKINLNKAKQEAMDLI